MYQAGGYASADQIHNPIDERHIRQLQKKEVELQKMQERYLPELRKRDAEIEKLRNLVRRYDAVLRSHHLENRVEAVGDDPITLGQTLDREPSSLFVHYDDIIRKSSEEIKRLKEEVDALSARPLHHHPEPTEDPDYAALRQQIRLLDEERVRLEEEVRDMHCQLARVQTQADVDKQHVEAAEKGLKEKLLVQIEGLKAKLEAKEEEARERAANEKELQYSLDNMGVSLKKEREKASQMEVKVQELQLALNRVQMESLQHAKAGDNATARGMSLAERVEMKEKDMETLQRKMQECMMLSDENWRTHIEALERAHKREMEECCEKLQVIQSEYDAIVAKLQRAEDKLREVESKPESSPVAESSASLLAEMQVRCSKLTNERDDLMRRLENESNRHRREERLQEQEVNRMRTELEACKNASDQAEHLAQDQVKRLAQLEQQIQLVTADLRKEREAHLDSNMKKDAMIQKKRKEATAAEERLAKQAEEHAGELQAAEKRADSIQKACFLEMQRLRDEIAELTKTASDEELRCRIELERASAKERELMQKISDLTKALSSVKSEKGMIEVVCERLKNGIKSRTDELRSTSEKMTRMLKRDTTLMSQLNELKLHLEKERMESARVGRENQRLVAKIQDMQRQLVALGERRSSGSPLRIGRGTRTRKRVKERYDPPPPVMLSSSDSDVPLPSPYDEGDVS